MSAQSQRLRTVGIIGAGKSGTAIARRALAAGYSVRIAGSGSPARTRFMADILAPGAITVSAAEVAEGSDIVVLAAPLRALPSLPLGTLSGKVVVDAMNYWPPVDGSLSAYDDRSRPSSQVVAAQLPASTRVVKTLNHIGYHEIEELARPAGSADRVALAVAGDDESAVAVVSQFIDELGFAPIVAGGLGDSGPLQPGSEAFGADLGEVQLRKVLAHHASVPRSTGK